MPPATPGVNPGASVTGTRGGQPPPRTQNANTLPFSGERGTDAGGFTALDPTNFPEYRQRASEGNLFGTLARQRTLLGELGGLLPQNMVLRASDVPLFEAGLNFQQTARATEDRATGIGRLEDARSNIGISPESVLARELAVQRARGDGPLGGGAIEQSRSDLRQQSAVGHQDAQRGLAEQFAQRGIGGGVPAYQAAAMEQAYGVNAAGQLAQFDLQAAQLQETAQRQAFSDLNALAMEEEMRRTALDQLIASQYLNTEYQGMDLSGLLGLVPNGDLAVGGGGLVL